MGARREQVLDAAIGLVAEEGTHELTHRKIDAKIPAPLGTTSNYFPSRRALALGILAEIIKTDREFLDTAAEYDAALAGEELLLAWLRRRATFVLGPWRLHALAWYRFIVEDSTNPDVHTAITEVRREVFSDAEAIVARAGSTDVRKHTRIARSYIGGVLLTQHLLPVNTSNLDRLLAPMARGLMHVIRRDAGVDVGTP